MTWEEDDGLLVLGRLLGDRSQTEDLFARDMDTCYLLALEPTLVLQPSLPP